jgi:hypothetical protein
MIAPIRPEGKPLNIVGCNRNPDDGNCLGNGSEIDEVRLSVDVEE